MTRSELIERLIGRTRSKQSFHVEGRKGHDVLLQAFDVKDYIKKEKLEIEVDASGLEDLCKKIISEQPKAVEEYKAGKEKSIDFLVGQVMRALKGKANAKETKEMFVKLLN